MPSSRQSTGFRKEVGVFVWKNGNWFEERTYSERIKRRINWHMVGWTVFVGSSYCAATAKRALWGRPGLNSIR